MMAEHWTPFAQLEDCFFCALWTNDGEMEEQQKEWVKEARNRLSVVHTTKAQRKKRKQGTPYWSAGTLLISYGNWKRSKVDWARRLVDSTLPCLEQNKKKKGVNRTTTKSRVCYTTRYEMYEVIIVQSNTPFERCLGLFFSFSFFPYSLLPSLSPEIKKKQSTSTTLSHSYSLSHTLTLTFVPLSHIPHLHSPCRCLIPWSSFCWWPRQVSLLSLFPTVQTKEGKRITDTIYWHT